MNSENLLSLLKKIEHVLERNEEIVRIKKESFNIFSILRKEHDEEKLHSAFLAELLNCKGSHGLKTTFCKLFVKRFLIDKPVSSQFTVDETVKVRKEKSIGDLGQIDIYLENGEKEIIIIENKIYAEDQEEQLIRYNNHLKKITGKEKHKGTLIYLTLNGDLPAEISINSRGNTLKEGEVYYCRSYKVDIIDWLNDCLKEAADFPFVRETIKQYIILLKKLTHQLENEVMDDIRKIITENYEAAKAIEASVKNVELDKTTSFLKDIKKAVINKLNANWSIELDTDLSKAYTGIKIRHKHWVDNIVVKLQGESKIPWNSVIYGIAGDKNKSKNAKIKEILSNVEILKLDFKESQHFIFYKYIFDSSTDNEIKKIFSNSEREELVEKVSEKLIALSLACENVLAMSKK
ncbi:MAG: PD-(D/E)XK nuclease family protein [Bacteroidales bacterium]|jgi:hypothetical protein|nr:PD-(D/E)XK nuclease family protein [Bacteroidales bacterium]